MCGYARHRKLRRAYLHTPGWVMPAFVAGRHRPVGDAGATDG